MKTRKGGNRVRKVTFASIAAAIGAILLASGGAAAAEGSITFVSWGGSFQKAEREAFLKPAAAALGIVIKEDTTNGIADVPNKITLEMAQMLPSSPANRTQAVVFNPTWWVGRMNVLQERYDLLIQE
jgi:hypothetical protein